MEHKALGYTSWMLARGKAGASHEILKGQSVPPVTVLKGIWGIWCQDVAEADVRTVKDELACVWVMCTSLCVVGTRERLGLLHFYYISILPEGIRYYGKELVLRGISFSLI